MSYKFSRHVGERPTNNTKVPQRAQRPLTPLSIDQAGSPVVGSEFNDDGRFEYTVQNGLRKRGDTGPALSWGSLGPSQPLEPGDPHAPGGYEPLHKATIADVAKRKGRR